MKPLIFLCVLFLASAYRANGNVLIPLDGNDLLAGCQQEIKVLNGDEVNELNTQKALVTFGYIQGIADTIYNLHYAQKIGTDIPKGATPTQLVKVIEKFLNEHPERLNENPALLVAAALRDAFPGSAIASPTP